MSKPVHVLNREAAGEEIVNMAAIAVVDVEECESRAARNVSRLCHEETVTPTREEIPR